MIGYVLQLTSHLPSCFLSFDTTDRCKLHSLHLVGFMWFIGSCFTSTCITANISPLGWVSRANTWQTSVEKCFGPFLCLQLLGVWTSGASHPTRTSKNSWGTCFNNSAVNPTSSPPLPIFNRRIAAFIS